ncbi:MAG: insulinase family protein [Deltaproteobacteria bacterium]|nr:insulinase family protein [Deltaproteobacteria bacterium]
MLLATSATAAGTTAAADTEPPRIVRLPSPSSPLVSIRLVFQVGTSDEKPGQEGLAALTAAMLGEASTRKRTWSEVLDALYPMAAHIDYYGDKDATVFAGTVHRDNLEKFAALLAEQILLPRFSLEDFARLKQDALDFITKTLRGNDDEDLGKQALATLLYPGHPYGYPTQGTVAGLDALNLDDVRRFHAERFTRDRLILGMAGGYPETFPAAYAARFAGLPASGKPRRPLPPPAGHKGLRLLLVEKPSLGNAISIGHPIAVTRADDDFYPLFVAASYLGEHRTFNGVLMLNMRQKRGLNYGDYAYIENFIQHGYTTFPLTNIPRRQQHFEIWLRPVPPASTGFAVRQAIYETDKLIREGIPAPGFAATRQFLGNYVNLWAQDGSRRLGYAIDAEIYGKDVIAELRARLPRMTKADVDRAVRKHLSAENLAAVVVGDKAAALADALAAGQPTPIVYDTKDTPAEVLAEDKIIEKHPLRISPGDIKIVPVKKMFEK